MRARRGGELTLFLLALAPSGAGAVSFEGMAWVKGGYTSNLNLTPPELPGEKSFDSNSGGEWKISQGEWKKDVLSLQGRADLQRYLKAGTQTAKNLTVSATPQYRFWSSDERTSTTLAYRLSRSLPAHGLGAGADTTSHLFRVGASDQLDSSHSLSFNVKYRLTKYSGTDRTDGNFNLSTELSRQLSSAWQIGIEPSFEGNASDVKDSASAGPSLALSATFAPSDRFFVLAMLSGSIKRFAELAVTDTTFLALASLTYSLSADLSAVLEVSALRNQSSDGARAYEVYNPLAGLEYRF